MLIHDKNDKNAGKQKCGITFYECVTSVWYVGCHSSNVWITATNAECTKHNYMPNNYIDNSYSRCVHHCAVFTPHQHTMHTNITISHDKCGYITSKLIGMSNPLSESQFLQINLTSPPALLHVVVSASSNFLSWETCVVPQDLQGVHVNMEMHNMHTGHIS